MEYGRAVVPDDKYLMNVKFGNQRVALKHTGFIVDEIMQRTIVWPKKSHLDS